MTSGTAHYAREGGTWILKLGGEVRHPLGPAINALLDRAFADPEFNHFVVDLSQTQLIDSTCLGILARIANQLQRIGGDRPTLLAPGEDIHEILRVVCFDRVFNLLTDEELGPAPLEALPEVAADERGRLALVLEAHRRLCELDAHTRDVFQDLVQALEEEQRRQGKAP